MVLQGKGEEIEPVEINRTRDPGEIGIESWVNIGEGGPDHWAAEIDRWKSLGATYISVNTMGAGLASPKAHMDAIRHFKEAVGNP